MGELPSPFRPVERSTLEQGLSLCARLPELSAFDAVLAAVALEAGATALVSGDRAIASIPTLRFVRWPSPALRELIDAA